MTLARAPGRVNLIGEHTDYNDGFVLPAAIGLYTTVEGSPRNDRTLDVRSGEGSASFDLDALPRSRSGTWIDYARGVLIELQRAGVAPTGAELRIATTLPIGGGLSSSAAFEVAIALAVMHLAGATMDRMKLAQLCQRSEIEHVGIRSGIMDQFAVLFGSAGNALLLDTRTLAWRPVAVSDATRIVICNTMVKHELAAGEYNRRRRECEAAVAQLQRWYPAVNALRDVTPEQLIEHESEMDPIAFRRARHVVGENARVLQFVDAMESGDVARAGELMNASHESLRYDYEVSAPELDLLAAIARGAGAYGARMTGGGFGGCTVNLVKAGSENAFCARIVEEYRTATGITPEVYDGQPVDGAA